MSVRTTDVATDGSTIEEQQLHQNLILLGLSGPGCKTAPAGIDMGKFTFRKPSSKTLEFVLYSLYAVIVGEAVAQKVRKRNHAGLASMHGIRGSGMVQ